MADMEDKTILRQVFSDVSDQLVKDLPLIAFIRQQNDRSTDNELKTNSQIYLDLISKVVVMLDADVGAGHSSTTDETIAIAERLDFISTQYESRRLNASLEKSLAELKASSRSLDQRLSECLREMKREEAFESAICDKIRFYSAKMKEYYTSVKSKETLLAKAGFTSTLRQEAIDDCKHGNEELRRRLHDINARLNGYKDFKPTEEALRHKIDEMKAQISEYDNYFEK